MLYTGVTNNLSRRVTGLKKDANPNPFTSKYKVNILVYLEEFNSITEVIKREKQIKAGSR
ncbi:MAG: GIY-YIG nuclease family protein [Bacteroidia bacterium]|nr:GIY-YIG nuclease family protein [Bacteroidia bacterium]